MANTPLIRINGITLYFDGGQTRALNGVDLTIQEGEFVAIVGPSGSGKSSILNVIGTLDTPTAGEIYFRDQAYSTIRDASLFRRENFGFIFQGFHLIPTLSALDNVIVPTIGCEGSSHKARAEALLNSLGLQDRLDHFPGKLAGGERQRVAIARSLINQPRVILADEPTGSLDSANAQQVLDLLAQVVREQGLTLIMVTHDASVSARADRIVHMRDGRVEHPLGAFA
ncbi:ABC transporter ATP-binding protein [Gallionella capsiferriformans]|uniref:ABC transporter related n=1 Tax=Gallionella capsiferriformans (strain ES-2) TaxID=395494 RepID=D9SJU6_GALCS|nr:ABC transporter ATP-binding protein [Gallionella capsiferriformans]ADL54445.1 ABC transporter related [Gallionella capsiferriformans ES-2]